MRLMNKHVLDFEHVKQKHLTDMKDLEDEDDTILQKEIPKMQNDISVLENELVITEQRLKNIKEERDVATKATEEYKQMKKEVESLQVSLGWKESQENNEMESL